MENRYDVAVIGSGPGGYVAAIRCAQLGLKTVLVEKNGAFGGTCLNTGCIPSKALLDSTELLVTARSRMKLHGINIDPDNIRVDLKQMMARKNAVVEKMTGGVKTLLASYKVDTFQGTGSLKRGNIIIVEKSGGSAVELNAGKIILATGSIPVELDALPFDGVNIVDSTSALSFEKVPEKLAVIGAGAIGLEMGSVWYRLGSEVTVIEIANQILPNSDSIACNRLMQMLKNQGLKIMLSSRVVSAVKNGNTTSLTVEEGLGKRSEFTFDKVLVAAGRKPFTAGLGLEDAGVKTDGKTGRITVDGKLRTAADGIYAIGDLVHGPMLAHKASDEGIAVAEIIGTGFGSVNYMTIPSVVYTWPEYASVGPTEDELKEKGTAYVTGIFQFRANGRALSSENGEGYVRIFSAKQDDRLLGAQIIGPWASDLICEIVTVMEFGGNAEDIARTVHAHPTLSEAVRESAMDAGNRSIHSLKKLTVKST